MMADMMEMNMKEQELVHGGINAGACVPGAGNDNPAGRWIGLGGEPLGLVLGGVIDGRVLGALSDGKMNGSNP